MAMPCTGFSQLQICFAQTHPEAFKRALLEGTRLAVLAGSAAIRQMSWKKHFLAGNPLQSKLWKLSLWQRILNLPTVYAVACDQCAYGLMRPDGLFIKKPTKLVASAPSLLKHLGRKCPQNHDHGDCYGSVRGEDGKWLRVSKLAQVWPLDLCRSIVRGIFECAE